jgi:cellulose synthase operon protein C
MDPREVDTLVQRLVANPHDQEVLAYAHQAGASDPRSYATLLERVGRETQDPAYASHWLSEAANVWSTTLGDAHHAAEVLLLAVVKDPTQDVAAERLGQLYREKGDIKGLVALLEKRAKLLAPLSQQNPDMALKVASMHEELGTLWAEPPLQQADRALQHYKRAYETDPRSQFAIYSARELFKSQRQWAEAIPLFEMEQALVAEPERKVALYRDEATVRKSAGDLAGATEILRTSRSYAPDDYGLIQELATLILERVQAGQPVGQEERDEGAEYFVALAEAYDGENGFAYSVAALDLVPGHDRGVQLATHYGNQLGRGAELPPRWKRYLDANPSGAMAPQIRQDYGSALEQSGNVDQAIGVMKGGVGDAQAEAKLTELYQSQGRTEEAVAHLESQSFEAPSPERVAKLLESASLLASKRQNKEALARYMEVLSLDPVSPEALSWVDEHLRQKRQFPELRDVYQSASRAPNLAPEQRKKYLSTVASICEQQLRDLDGAINALKQLSQIDGGARENLRRLLEKGQRWDDLAVLLDQESSEAPDQEQQIALLKKLAALHEQKRKDLVGAGEAWARMANLMSGDESPINAAVKLFDKAQRPDLAALAISDNVGAIEAADARMVLLNKLGDLREKANDFGGAGEAFAEAAEAGGGSKAWEAAERCFAQAERWEDTARAIGELANVANGSMEKAALHYREAEYLFRAGDIPSGILRLEQAADLDPINDTYSLALEERYKESERVDDLIQFMQRRADKLPDKAKRVTLRKRTAEMLRSHVGDAEGTREMLMKVLEDGDDLEALTMLADDARERSEYQEEVSLLHRLAGVTADSDGKIQVLMREASVLCTDINELETAADRYSEILRLDAKNLSALTALADVEERRENYKGAAEALEKMLGAATEKDEKIAIARRLASIYETNLEDVRGAIRAFEVVAATDADDFEAVQHLVELCESVEMWDRTAELLGKLIEVEGDASEASSLARRLSGIMEERLGKGQEALAVLEGLADEGDEACREAYIELGDKLNFKGIVAMKMRDWYATAGGAKQHEAWRGAFERFIEMGREGEAAQLAVELIRNKGATPEIVDKLEEVAVKLKDLDALSAAHDMRAREVSGADRAAEYVRQAEILVQAGVDPVEAVQHGEQGLTSVPPGEVEPLLERLGALLPAPGHIVDLYERQVGRCKQPPDRLNALARAAQVATLKGAPDRAQSLFELALGGGVREETLEVLERSAADGDAKLGGTLMRQTLANSLASGSQGLRDGGRTRSALLRRAANLAFRELGDAAKAFDWLAQALITHVEPATLDALEELGEQANDLQKVEAVLGKALEEVFDGPLVRQVVSRRAKLRRERLGDKQGAAADLKKLHDLSPTDAAITDELYLLLTELRDYRSMVQLLEDQILRGKDPAVRAELARKAARLWEERLADPREAADAWRRVLRMKPGDPEAQGGLERAKSNMLKKPESIAPPAPEEYSPKPSQPPPAKPKSAPPPATMPSGQFPTPSDTSENLTTQELSAPPLAEEHVKPQRPDISFRRPTEEEQTLSTPVEAAAPAVEGMPDAGQAPAYVPEDEIESLDDDAESVEDDELIEDDSKA